MKRIAAIVLIAVTAAVLVGLKQCSRSKSGTPPTLDGAAGLGDGQQVPERDPKHMQREIWEMTPDEKDTWRTTGAQLYGMVVDQFGQPVSGAEIDGVPTLDIPDNKLRKFIVKTGKDGKFSIIEPNCPTLRVGASAVGYYNTLESYADFCFAEPPQSMPASLRKRAQPPTRTSPENPAILILKKMGSREPLLNLRTLGDLKEVQTYQIGTQPGQAIQVKHWFDPVSKRMHPNNWPIYDWGVEVAVVDGGLIQINKPATDDSDAHVAPVDGYQPSIRFAFDSTMSDTDIKFLVLAHFFVKFSNGTYGRLDVDFDARTSRRRAHVESWYNPSGSRSTEFDPTIQIETPPAPR